MANSSTILINSKSLSQNFIFNYLDVALVTFLNKKNLLDVLLFIKTQTIINVFKIHHFKSLRRFTLKLQKFWYIIVM